PSADTSSRLMDCQPERAPLSAGLLGAELSTSAVAGADQGEALPARSRARNSTWYEPEAAIVVVEPDAGAVHRAPFLETRLWYPATPLPTSVEPDAEMPTLPVTHELEPPLTVGTVGRVRSIVHRAMATRILPFRLTRTRKVWRPAFRPR